MTNNRSIPAYAIAALILGALAPIAAYGQPTCSEIFSGALIDLFYPNYVPKEFEGNPLTQLFSGKVIKIDPSYFPMMEYVNDAKGVILTSERSRIETGKNSFLNSMISEVQNEGGEIRLLHKRVIAGANSRKVYHLSYFRVTSDWKPIMVIESGADRGTIRHEFEHFLDWRALKEKYLNQGLSDRDAAEKASIQFQTFIERQATEANAVRVQMQEVPFQPRI